MTDELRERRIRRELDGLREDAQRLEPGRREAAHRELESMKKEAEDAPPTMVLSFRTPTETAERAEALVAYFATLTGMPPYRLSRADVLRDAVERGLAELERLELDGGRRGGF